VSGALRQSGLVGRVYRVTLADGERVMKHVTPERLRRLGEINRLAPQRLSHEQSG